MRNKRTFGHQPNAQETCLRPASDLKQEGVRARGCVSTWVCECFVLLREVVDAFLIVQFGSIHGLLDPDALLPHEDVHSKPSLTDCEMETFSFPPKSTEYTRWGQSALEHGVDYAVDVLIHAGDTGKTDSRSPRIRHSATVSPGLSLSHRPLESMPVTVAPQEQDDSLRRCPSWWLTAVAACTSQLREGAPAVLRSFGSFANQACTCALEMTDPGGPYALPLLSTLTNTGVITVFTRSAAVTPRARHSARCSTRAVLVLTLNDAIIVRRALVMELDIFTVNWTRAHPQWIQALVGRSQGRSDLPLQGMLTRCEQSVQISTNPSAIRTAKRLQTRQNEPNAVWLRLCVQWAASRAEGFGLQSMVSAPPAMTLLH
ncbi:hypothetical protein TREES_T100020530 [Tupaia chinensis]|uniref:Uncharacterized protein n=1 Tax=Tupaia chinensis TaxID=246437 RepID=L9KVI3_TUPCH|nr:hypothetical protein TREES_T100020530 [Tupaia chinensis]